jgi:hypothetical protein
MITKTVPNIAPHMPPIMANPSCFPNPGGPVSHCVSWLVSCSGEEDIGFSRMPVFFVGPLLLKNDYMPRALELRECRNPPQKLPTISPITAAIGDPKITMYVIST